MARSTLTLKIQGEQDPPAPYVDQVRHLAKNLNLSLLPGALDNQMDTLFAQEATISSGGTAVINLQTDLDRFGQALTLTDAALVYIAHAGTTGQLTINADATEPWTQLLSTTADVTLRPGDFLLVGALTADNLAVTAGGRQLKLTAVSADVDYVVSIWGRK